MSEPITEEWLKSVGFKWHQLARQPNKQWLLWLGDAVGKCFEDIGIEVTSGAYTAKDEDARWFCWLRADYSGRYSRFIHVRHIQYTDDVIAIVEGITGQKWDVANNLYGSMRKPEDAARIHAEHERLDRKMMRERPWRETEKDDSMGRALPEHLEAYEKLNLKKHPDL